MSMLSAQCDRLRKMADWDGVGAVIACELRDAADTIWRLRNDCVELREQLNLVLESKCFAEHRVSELLSENTKLWELCADMYGFIHAACVKYPRMFDPNIGPGGQMVREMPDVRYADRMRKLGVGGGVDDCEKSQ